MGNIGLLKRALPFLGTFALGLFIASFFVNISPGFEHHERGRWHHDMWELRIENEQLREENRHVTEENQQLREQLEEQNIPPAKMSVSDELDKVLDSDAKTVYPAYPPKWAGVTPKASKSHK